jgi:hypothetical protein
VITAKMNLVLEAEGPCHAAPSCSFVSKHREWQGSKRHAAISRPDWRCGPRGLAGTPSADIGAAERAEGAHRSRRRNPEAARGRLYAWGMKLAGYEAWRRTAR